VQTRQPIPPAFLERARREAERYGGDPWILLRELVQNSRDAGASHIAFSVQRRGALEELACEDDGSGMSRADMGSYLLRLYASGKAPPPGESLQKREDGPVGRFGVGFWSVLRFSPAVVRVESRNAAGERTGFEVDCVGLSLREVESTLEHAGTRVTLIRPAREEPLAELVRDGLLRWAGHVKGVGGRRPPRLLLDGVPLNRSFRPPALIGDQIRGSGFDGVIGLARRPQVRLYAHGLLIREVGSLEELLPRRSRGKTQPTPGLYPVVHINADGLEVLMDRQAVVEDELLESIVTSSERRLLRLRRRLLDRLAPLRLWDRLRLAGPRAVVPAGLAGAALAGALLVALFAPPLPLPASLAPTRAPIFGAERAEGPAARALVRPANRALDDAIDAETGPRINRARASLGLPSPWDISVSGPGQHLMKLGSHTRRDERRGLIGGAPAVRSAYPRLSGEPQLSVSMAVSAGEGFAVLPAPTDQAVLPKSVRLDGRAVPVFLSTTGEALIRQLPDRPSRASYETCACDVTTPTPAVGGRVKGWPGEARRVMRSVSGLPTAQQAAALSGWVQRRVRYSTDPADAERFDELGGSFVSRTLGLGVGDCDVMNALVALMLRELGVPARLAVGIVVDDGEVAPDLHAWTEYWDDGWRSLDASPPLEVPGAREATVAEAPASAAAAAPSATAAPTQSARPATSPAPRPAASPEPRPAPRSTELRALAPTLLGGTLVVVGLALLVLVFLRLRRTARPDPLDDEAVADLLEHVVRHPGQDDPLHLRRRPLFPSLDGRLLSLVQLEKLAEAGRLLAARSGCALLDVLEASVPVLDRDSPRVARLLELLPEVVVLEELAGISAGGPGTPALERIESLLRGADPGLRLHLVADDDGIREVELPVRPGGLAPRHILVGARSPAALRVQPSFDEAPGLHVFRLAQAILDQTTRFRARRDVLLAQLAREALG
jgi:transglutaminase-like putative cysteine protease